MCPCVMCMLEPPIEGPIFVRGEGVGVGVGLEFDTDAEFLASPGVESKRVISS